MWLAMKTGPWTVNSNHLDVVGRGGYGWREEVDRWKKRLRDVSETFGHPRRKECVIPAFHA